MKNKTNKKTYSEFYDDETNKILAEILGVNFDGLPIVDPETIELYLKLKSGIENPGKYHDVELSIEDQEFLDRLEKLPLNASADETEKLLSD